MIHYRSLLTPILSILSINTFGTLSTIRLNLHPITLSRMFSQGTTMLSWDPSPKFFWLPSFSAIRHLRMCGVKVVIVWFDSCSDKFISTITRCLDLANLHVLAENTRLDFGESLNGKYFSSHPCIISPCLPVSADFFYPDYNKDIDLSFLGRVESYRSYRLSTIQYLMSMSIPIFLNPSSSLLSWDDYRSILSRSKMTLNFSYSVNCHQLKGRAFHAFWAKSLLFESSNSQISTFFEPYKHYVPYDSDSDLATKIKLYREDNDLRQTIINSAYSLVRSKYNSLAFWSSLFALI